MSYFDFQRAVRGYDYYCKKTNKQIFRYQMYYWGLTPAECRQKFNVIVKNTRG